MKSVDGSGWVVPVPRTKPLLLTSQSGVCLHEEKAFGGGRATTPEDAAVLLGWAKELNCNRAAVILWSVANKTPLSNARLTFLSNLAATVRRLDPTRLVTAALETKSYEDGAIHIDDPHASLVP